MRQKNAVALSETAGSDFEATDVTAPVQARPTRTAAPLQPARPVTASPAASNGGTTRSAPNLPVTSATSAAPQPSMLFQVLKEELFELEVEHKQGKISQQEYEKAKAALDGTLERAIKRESQKV